MSWFITLIVGVLLGWIVSAVMRSSWHTGTWTNIFLGVAGSIVGVWFFAFVLGIGTTDTSFGSFQGISLLWEVIGSLVTLYVVNAISLSESASDERSGESPAYSAGTAHQYSSTAHEYKKGSRNKN